MCVLARDLEEHITHLVLLRSGGYKLARYSHPSIDDGRGTADAHLHGLGLAQGTHIINEDAHTNSRCLILYLLRILHLSPYDLMIISLIVRCMHADFLFPLI